MLWGLPFTNMLAGGQGALGDDQLQARLRLELLGVKLPGSPLVDRLRVPPT